MELILQRGSRIPPLSLPGEMTVDGQHVCWTLENADLAIPAGRYPIMLYDSPKRRCEVPLLVGVPGRSMIEIHWGTFPQNYEGCIGVGEMRDMATGEIFNTHVMWTKLMPAIEGAIDAEGCWITVIDAPSQSPARN